MTDTTPSDRLPRPDFEWAWFFDIDGTLAAIAASPDAALVEPAMLGLVDDIHERTGGALALISGRPIREIDKLFPDRSFPAAGQHGAERRLGNGHTSQHAVADDALDTMRTALREMEHRHAGLLLEDKGLSLTLHYRQVPRLGAFVLREVGALFQQMGPGYLLQTGKCVVEIVPAGHTKGSVVTEFMAEPPFRGRIPAFLGDDVTDENAFTVVNALGGFSFKVGPGPTQAKYRIRDVDGVRDWLSALPHIAIVPRHRAGDAA